MDGSLLLLLAVTFCLSTVSYFTFNKRQRELLAKRFQWRSRRPSSAGTPPRSLTPETKVPNNGSSPVDYVDSFPPSRREALANLAPSLPVAERENLIGHEIDPELFARSLIPLSADYRECDGNKYTPTGFSLEEVRVLGDFPDYATLSGVPLPQAYEKFDIEKANPRPYRPFRWAYHQTMCKYFLFCQYTARNLMFIQSSYQARAGLVVGTREELQGTYCTEKIVVRAAWQICPAISPRLGAGVQGTHGDEFAIPLRTVSSIL